MSDKLIFKSNGNYLGFVRENNIFSRDGDFLGWIDNINAWDKSGAYRGELKSISGNSYILKNQYAVPPLPKAAKSVSNNFELPNPPANIASVEIPIGYVDAF